MFSGGWEWILILLVVLILFGARRIPQIMGDIGKGASAFKKGLKDDPVETAKKPSKKTKSE